MAASGATTTTKVSFSVTVHGLGDSESVAVCVSADGVSFDPSTAVHMVQKLGSHTPEPDKGGKHTSVTASHWYTIKPLLLNRGVQYRYRFASNCSIATAVDADFASGFPSERVGHGSLDASARNCLMASACFAHWNCWSVTNV